MQHLDNPFFDKMIPINYGDNESSWRMFYCKFISPFANTYKNFIQKEQMRKSLVQEEIVNNQKEAELKKRFPHLFRQKDWYYRKAHASLNRGEEQELMEILQRISSLVHPFQRELLLAAPMTASTAQQLRFLSKYKSLIKCFIEERAKQTKEVTGYLPPVIQKALEEYRLNQGKERSREGVSILRKRGRGSTCSSLGRSVHVQKTGDLLPDIPFDIPLSNANHPYPLLRGKSCSCKVYS